MEETITISIKLFFWSVNFTYVSFIEFTWITTMDVRYSAGHACPVVVDGYGYHITLYIIHYTPA